MEILTIEDTGLDHLYPEGVPIAEVEILIADVYAKVARITSLAVQADPYFTQHSEAQKAFSELHGEGDRISRDFLSDGAEDILPVFQVMQRWMTDEAPGPIYEFDSVANAGKIIYRWQIMDTRLEDQKINYTSDTLIDIRVDLNQVLKVKKYLADALRDFMLRELYETVGHDKKHAKYAASYELNRQYVAFWAKDDTSLQTQYHYAGV